MIKLTKPYIPDVAIQKAAEVMMSGQLVQGQYVNKLEEELSKYLGVKHTIVVSNGTAALHLSLMALGIKAGDEVIVPAFTYPATANVVEVIGAKTVPVDIRLDDYCIDASLIESAITPKTKAIIPVHEFGQSAQIDDIIKIARKHNLVVIEDAACALGCEFKEKKIGSFGELGCFSFHPRKAITTGEGGAVTTNDDVLASKLRSLRNHGISLTENGAYDFVYAGLNYRLTDFQAAIGLFQLHMFEEILEKRMHIADFYNKQLHEVNWLHVPARLTGRRMVFQTYHLLLDQKINRAALMQYLKDHKIETNFGAYALSSLTYYHSKYGFRDADFPNSVNAYNYGLALPVSHELSDEDMLYITNTIKSFRQ